MHLFIKRLSMQQFSIWLVFFCVLFSSALSHARIESLCELANPCSVTGDVVVGESSTITISWRGSVINDGTANGPVEFISSTNGIYAGQGNISLGTNPASVAQNVSYSGTMETPFTLIETVVIPESVTNDAASQGLSRIYYGRQFNGPTNNRFGNVSFPLRLKQTSQPTLPGNSPLQNNPTTGPTLGDIGINRLALRFEDNSLVKLIGKNKELRAELQINYEKAGPFAGRWEIATPATSYGEPFFQALENVYTVLNGSRQMTLQSPVLPTDMLGLYLLRFVPADGAIDSDLLQLSYIVNEAGQSAEILQTLGVLSPLEGEPLNRNTLFEWQSLEDSYVYRLEFYYPQTNQALIPPPLDEVASLPLEQNGAEALSQADQSQVLVDDASKEFKPEQVSEEIISGMLVPGDLNKAKITALVAKRLEQGQLYRWRIAAFDSAGRKIGVSEWHENRHGVVLEATDANQPLLQPTTQE